MTWPDLTGEPWCRYGCDRGKTGRWFSVASLAREHERTCEWRPEADDVRPHR